MKSVEDLLDTYPRQRPTLSEAHQKIYLQEIQINRGEMGGLFYRLMGWLESWMHKKVGAAKSDGHLLEIGAGTLNHVIYEPTAKSYDFVEPIEALYEASPSKDRTRTRYADISEIELAPAYDKVVSIAAFEHVERLPELFARIGLLLNKEGRLCVGIPSEGGFLWGASWRCTTGVLFRLRNGLPYKPLMRFEHINDAEEILLLARTFFNQVRIKRFPLPLLHFSFYTYFEASDPKTDFCKDFLNPQN